MHIMIRDKKTQIFPLSKEVQLSASEETVSRTDIYGNILYYNHTFSKISGYGNRELLRAPHSILRHPDMPKAVFYFIWKTLLAGNSTYALIKNFTKNGDYYWQLIKFSILKDNQNRTVSFSSHGVQASQKAIKEVEVLYKRLLEDEMKYGMNSSIKSLLNFLNSNNIATYNDYICRVYKKRKHTLFSSFHF